MSRKDDRALGAIGGNRRDTEEIVVDDKPLQNMGIHFANKAPTSSMFLSKVTKGSVATYPIT